MGPALMTAIGILFILPVVPMVTGHYVLHGLMQAIRHSGIINNLVMKEDLIHTSSQPGHVKLQIMEVLLINPVM